MAEPEGEAAGAARRSPVWPSDGREAWEELSPDGLTRVEWAVSHGRMSHFMITPQLYDAASGELLLALDPSFDGTIDWGEGGSFGLFLRHYLRAGFAMVEIERAAGRFRLLDEGEAGPWIGLDRLKCEGEARFTPSLEELDRRAREPWTPPPAEPWWPLAPWRIAAVLLCLAVAATALWWPGD